MEDCPFGLGVVDAGGRRRMPDLESGALCACPAGLRPCWQGSRFWSEGLAGRRHVMGSKATFSTWLSAQGGLFASAPDSGLLYDSLNTS